MSIGFGLVFRLHSAKLIAVGQGNTALTLGHGANHRCVAAEDRLGQVEIIPLIQFTVLGLPISTSMKASRDWLKALHSLWLCQGVIAAHLIGLNQISVERWGPQTTGQA